MLTYILSLTLLTAGVIAIRALFKNKVPARLTYAIWLAVVLRLCIPFDLIQLDVPAGHLGIASVVKGFESYISESIDLSLIPDTSSDNNEEGYPEKGEMNEDASEGSSAGNVGGNVMEEVGGDAFDKGEAGVLPDKTPGDVGGSVSSDKTDYTQGDSYGKPTAPDADEPAGNVAATVIKSFAVIWVIGSAVTLCVFGTSYAAFVVKLRRNREYFGKTGKTRICVSDKVTSPCVSGIMPTIYITPEAAKSESLPVILLHEKTHMVHGDHLWNVVRVAAVVLHWWNPLVWAAAILSRRDAELACDESVAKKLDSKDRLEYAKMIVNMTPVKKNCAVGFGDGPIKERVINLTKKNKYRIIVAVLAIVIAAVIAVAAFIGGKDTPVKPDDGTDTANTETKAVETEEPIETGKDDEPKYREYGNLIVYDYEDYDPEKLELERLTPYDMSKTEQTYKFVIELKESVSDFNITSMIWKDTEFVEKEWNVKGLYHLSNKGNKFILCVDSVENVGTRGIKYSLNNKVYRFYPVQNEDGNVELISIDDRLGPWFYNKSYESFTLSMDDNMSLTEALSGLHEDTAFTENYLKCLDVKGFSTPVYIMMNGDKADGIWAHVNYTKLKFTGGAPELFGEGVNAQLYEHNGAVILSSDRYEVGDTWIVTPNGITEFHPEDGTSVTITKNEDGSLGYSKFAVRYKDIHVDSTAPLELAPARDEFLREVGVVSIGDDGKVTLTPEKTYTVSDVYDLDALYGEYRWSSELIRKYPYCESADDVIEQNSGLQELRDIAEKNNDNRYKWIAAFLDGDFETCVSMTNTYGQMYSDDEEKSALEALMQSKLKAHFDSISIGNYTIEEKSGQYENKYLQFDFEVVSSGSNEYPVGDYTVYLEKTGYFTSPNVSFVKRPDMVQIEDEYERSFAETLFYCSWDNIPGKVNRLESICLYWLYDCVYGENEGGVRELTYAQLEEIAEKTLPGSVDGTPFEINTWGLDHHTADDGSEYYTVRGMGGLVILRDLINRTESDGVITYDVRYYSDVHNLLCAQVVRFTVVRTDTEYGYKLAGVELIVDTGLEIFSHGT